MKWLKKYIHTCDERKLKRIKKFRDLIYIVRILPLHHDSSCEDAELFDEIGRKNYFYCRSKEIAIDFTCILSQITRRLSKLIRFNILDVSAKNASELVSICPHISFKDDVNDLFNHAA